MPGSLREKRPGAWELRVFLGRDAAGKVRHRSHSFRGGKREAQRTLARLVASAEEADGPVLLDWGPDTTANDALAGWEANGWQDLSPTTVRRYRSIWDYQHPRRHRPAQDPGLHRRDRHGAPTAPERRDGARRASWSRQRLAS